MVSRSALIATIIIYVYTRDARSTLLLVGAAVLGGVAARDACSFRLTCSIPIRCWCPSWYSAIGISHGAQKMNGIMQDVGRGTHRYVAARYTFRRLFVAGLTRCSPMPSPRGVADRHTGHSRPGNTTSIGVIILDLHQADPDPVALSYIGVGERPPSAASRQGNGESARCALGR
jgi:hypothetical protein